MSVLQKTISLFLSPNAAFQIVFLSSFFLFSSSSLLLDPCGDNVGCSTRNLVEIFYVFSQDLERGLFWRNKKAGRNISINGKNVERRKRYVKDKLDSQALLLYTGERDTHTFSFVYSPSWATGRNLFYFGTWNKNSLGKPIKTNRLELKRDLASF